MIIIIIERITYSRIPDYQIYNQQENCFTLKIFVNFSNFLHLFYSSCISLLIDALPPLLLLCLWFTSYYHNAQFSNNLIAGTRSVVVAVLRSLIPKAFIASLYRINARWNCCFANIWFPRLWSCSTLLTEF